MVTLSPTDTSPVAKCSKNSHSIKTKWSIKMPKMTSLKPKPPPFRYLISTESASSIKDKKTPSKSSESSKPIKTATSSSTTTKPEPKTKPHSISPSYPKPPASNSPKILYQPLPSPKKEKSANSPVKSLMHPPFKTITTLTSSIGPVKII